MALTRARLVWFRTVFIVVLCAPSSGWSQVEDYRMRQDMERQMDADQVACLRRCVEENCQPEISETCRQNCRETCAARGMGLVPPILWLAPQSEREGAGAVAKELQKGPAPGRDTVSGGGDDLPAAALAIVAGMMILPPVLYFVDRWGSEKQFRQYRRPHFSLQTGAGVAFPESASVRASGSADWHFGSAGVDWVRWERNDRRIHRLAGLFGVVLPPKRHSSLRILGGPVWEWTAGQRDLGWQVVLPTTFFLPSDFRLRVDPRIGRLGGRVIAETGFHVGIPIFRKLLHLWLGGSALFRGDEVSGGPQLQVGLRH